MQVEFNEDEEAKVFKRYLTEGKRFRIQSVTGMRITAAVRRLGSPKSRANRRECDRA
jgi:hypothetical protein